SVADVDLPAASTWLFGDFTRFFGCVDKNREKCEKNAKKIAFFSKKLLKFAWFECRINSVNLFFV
ncbi:MAG: hypothetical protein IJF67_02140, partial [Clostridia bacterium]|nr:hypothetical protein [Clostridia bacterium]